MMPFPSGVGNVRPDMNMPMPIPTNPQGNPATQGVSLYVGNLDQEVNEQKLYEHFVQYGHIINTKVMRDSYNGESRGFGFVTFANINDALRAKSLLNYTKILDREIRIALKRNPTELNQSANLFFKNLDPTITSKKLEEECSKYGSIISCVVKVDEETGRPLGYGYVQFETGPNADECVQTMNNMKLGEKNISVSHFLPKNKRLNPYAKSNLYIKQFPNDWGKDKVEEYINDTFSIYGTISSCGVFEDKNISKYFAFVAFEEQEAAQKALVELNEFEVDHENKLYVSYAQDKATRRRTLKSKHLKFKNETNLYVKSLRADCDEARVRAVFEKYGTVTSVCIKEHEPKAIEPRQGANGQAPPMPQPGSMKLRFGFINFGTPEQAKNAFTECKKDPAFTALIDQTLNARGGEFIYYAQTKTVRHQYLRMQKKNMKTFKLIQDNVLQYYQLMKYFMPQNFRNQQRGGRVPNNKNPNFKSNNSYQNKNKFNSRGGFNNRDQMNMGGQNQFGMNPNMMGNMGQTPGPQGQTPMPNVQNGNTPAPNMMFNPDMHFGINPIQMPNMFNQPMGVNPQMVGAPNNMMGMPNQMGMMPNQDQPMAPAPVKDILWLKNNIATFEAYDSLEKKNILGNLMYPLVDAKVKNPEHVPKITGMLIDLEVLRPQEIVEIMENEESLKDRIDEAIGIINDTE